MKLYSKQDFAEKADWEGGLAELYNYGGINYVDEYDLSPEFKDAWRAFGEAYDRLKMIANEEIPESGEDDLG